MTLGVYDKEFQMRHALAIVRRYVDRCAQFNQDKSAIVYHQARGRKKVMPGHWGDGTPIKSRSGTVIETPQFVNDYCIMSAADALQMVNELSQE